MKTITANGLRFAFVEEGTGPLVLLLHGFPDTPHSWDAARPALAKAGYRAVSPFMRGYAPSEIPKGEVFDSDTLGRDVLSLIEALGERRAIVVGHDWGASAAYSAAALDPERIALLATLAIPHPASLRPSPSLLWAGRHFFVLSRKGAAARMRANDFAYVEELYRRWSPGWNPSPAEAEPVKAAFREPGCVEAALGYYRAAVRGVRLPPSHRLRITVPTVSFAGATDMIAPEAYDRAASWFTSTYEVIRVPGGHFMHREHPESFARTLVDAIERRLPSSAGSRSA